MPRLAIAALAAVLACSAAAQAQQFASGNCSPPNDVSRRWTPAQVMFATGSTAINADGQKAIAEQANLAKTNFIQQICLTGYTDKQGSAAANEKLARARAQAVAAALVKQGVDAKTILITPPLGASTTGTLPFGMGEKSAAERRVDIKFGR